MHHAEVTSSKKVSHLVGSENIRFATSFFWQTVFQIHAQVANLSIVLLHNKKARSKHKPHLLLASHLALLTLVISAGQS